MIAPDYMLSFIKGVTIETRSEDRTVVQMPITYQTLILKGLSISLREAINILVLIGATEEKLADKNAAAIAAEIARPKTIASLCDRQHDVPRDAIALFLQMLVGVLYQTMFLAATAMDLAPCVLRGGNSDLFAKAAGLDYYSETSVGEFLLGSKRIYNTYLTIN
jgi:hypothetical protein